MNDERTATVDLEDWRRWRLATYDVHEDVFTDGRPFTVVAVDEKRNCLVTQGNKGHWLPEQFVHFTKNGGAA